LGEAAQIVAFGQILAPTNRRVFVDATLPMTVWVDKVYLHPGTSRKALMSCHLADRAQLAD